MPKGQPKLVPQPWPNQGWEYEEVMLPYDGNWADALNKLGRAGWRVVTVIHDEHPEGKDTEARVLLERPRDKQWRDKAVADRDVKPDNMPDGDEDEAGDE